ncbi:hypothetical protein FRE64_10815 [Euhalothece natronophila Z-M001]|uniref:Uncharacterized protein n=1 Tax=Euhalothece natronophila Z-M001 TaxID=522448 RepID=A0A5B8NM56_9CHRO|nr:hypothetical protein [Euhalothece natronophila]QDZ40403.1 hypothetical protein FRE64_10815 [Euhalothece natronophila Z-M001]
MIDLPSLSIDPMGIRYGASKLFQILVPLTSYMVLRDLFLKKLVLREAIVAKIDQILPKNEFFEQFRADLPKIFDQTVGFLSWKVGCDLGFFLIVTGLGPWERAFTWSGLLPYTLAQYFVYFLIGRRMLVDGQLNPFSANSASQETPDPRPWWKKLLSKYLHEDLNTTNEHVPMRQVFLKPFVDYGGLVLSWSLYNVGIFFFQSGEMNLAPVVQFAFFQMLTFYLVNTYGYVIGYNIGELIDSGISALEERFSGWKRQQARLLNGSSQQKRGLFLKFYELTEQIKSGWQNVKYAYLWQLQVFLGQYGIGRKWVLTTVGGVFAVVLIAPSFSDVMFNVGGNVSDLWFNQMGKIDEVQVAQIKPAMSDSINLPNSEVVISRFPEFWQSVYIPEAQFDNIALDEGSSSLQTIETDTKR